jgi:hypothetical protein
MASSSENKDLKLTNRQKKYKNLKRELMEKYSSYKEIENKIEELQEELLTIEKYVDNRLSRTSKICCHPSNFKKLYTDEIKRSWYYATETVTNVAFHRCLLCRKYHRFMVFGKPLEFSEDNIGISDKDFFEWLHKTSKKNID